MILFKNVTTKYGKEVALENISFQIENGEFVFLTGVSGSGKTTLMKLLYKEILSNTGVINIFDKNISKIKTKKLRRRMGIVFQNYELLQSKTVFENVSYPLSCLGVNPFKVKKETLKALEKLNIADLAKKKPNELSGGQQQRVAIARAIVNNPDLLICDEPTGNLDSENTQIILEHLIQLNETGTTILMSTHSEEILKEMNKRVIHLEKGKLVKDGLYGDSLEEKKISEPVRREQKKEIEILNELNGEGSKNKKYERREVRGE